MSDEVNRNLPAAIDGFSDIEDRTEGDDEQQSGRVIQGERISFTNDFKWQTSNDEEIAKDREFVVVDMHRVLQKFVDGAPAGTIWVEPNQKWPDVSQLNESCPKSEWDEDLNGNPRGPWQRQRVVYMLDIGSMEKFTWITGTVGGDIAVCGLRDRALTMRTFRGAHVYPVVMLSNRFMQTRFGGRQRPDLKVVRWILMGPEGSALSAQPAAPQLPNSISAQAASADVTREALSKFHKVEPPSPGQEIDDDIPF